MPQGPLYMSPMCGRGGQGTVHIMNSGVLTSDSRPYVLQGLGADSPTNDMSGITGMNAGGHG